MTLDKDSDYEFVEVKVSHKIDLRLSLDDLLAMVQAQTAATEAAVQQLPAQVSSQLNQLNQLAQQLKGQIPHGGGSN
jgi:hypothetical protein